MLAPRLKSADNLHATFLITAAVFVLIGMALFMTTFFTAKEVVQRDVARVSFKQTMQTVAKNGPLARLCCSSLMYLTAQNIVGAIMIFYARDYLGGTASLLTLVTIITTGAVLYVGPFGPWITKVLGKKRGFILACVGTLIGAVIVYFAKTNIPMAMVGPVRHRREHGAAQHDDLGAGGRHGRVRRVEDAHPHRGRHLCRVLVHPQGRPGRGASLAGAALGYYGYVSAVDGKAQPQSESTLDGIHTATAVLPAAFFLSPY